MKKITAKAPVNIAIIKYWGKKDEIKVLPYNPSISYTLESLYTKTTLKEGTTPGVKFFINGILQSKNEHKKVIDFLSYFKGFNAEDPLIIESINEVPTAAGFASSASGFAALAVAANHYYNTLYDTSKLSVITRQGSGSAVRSLLGGCVLWQTDGTIEQIDTSTDDLAMIFVVINEKQKKTSSRDAMKHTVKTSYLYESWVEQAHKDAMDMLKVLKTNQFDFIGKIMESNSLFMHATMMMAQPPFTYFVDDSYRVYELVHTLREKNIPVYATMDAGPNVKLLTKKAHINTITKKLKTEGFNTLIVSNITKEGAAIINEKDDGFKAR
ncbi:diphosphomevalonate decarboxylase [Liberiplasma polymorphum]|uniref:diphosphomevalonate decarboxylase n=1 Tax=Liberiplasma polymorphum TaxID=3374570 RepID=UPI00377154AB